MLPHLKQLWSFLWHLQGMGIALLNKNMKLDLGSSNRYYVFCCLYVPRNAPWFPMYWFNSDIGVNENVYFGKSGAGSFGSAISVYWFSLIIKGLSIALYIAFALSTVILLMEIICPSCRIGWNFERISSGISAYMESPCQCMCVNKEIEIIDTR